MNFLQQLHEPFPQHKGIQKNILSLIGIGIFVTSFLYIFQPFGIGNANDQTFIICVFFGLITILFGITFDLFNVYILKIKTDLPDWTLGKWIIQTTMLLLWIAVGNFLFINIIDSSVHFRLWDFVQMIINTMLIGIFPVMFSGLITQIKASRIHQNEASHIHIETKEGLLTTDGDQLLQLDDIDPLPYIDILFIEAQQNYVNVYYLHERQLKSEMIRSTLSNLEEKCRSSSFVRCHRSYIININQVEAVTGNAQGLKAKIKNTASLEVPISRSYIATIKAHFEN